MSELNDLAIDRLVRELERSNAKHPDENPYFQAILKLAEDPKKQIRLLQSTLPMVLRNYYAVDVTFQKPILEFVYKLSQNLEHSDALSVKAYFIDVAYNFFSTTIKMNLMTYKNPKNTITYHSQDEEVLEPISDEILKQTLLWAKTFEKFLESLQAIEYVTRNRKELFHPFLMFIYKSEESLPKATVLCKAIKKIFYTCISILLQVEENVNYFVSDDNIIYQMLIKLYNKIFNYDELVSFYFLLVELAKSKDFPTHIANMNTIDEFFYKMVAKLMFPSLKDDKWKLIENENQDTELEFTFGFVLSKFYYAVCRVEKMRNEHIRYLKKGSPDYAYRFIYFLIERETYQGPLYMMLGLLNLLRTWNYELPEYSAKLTAHILKLLIIQDEDLLLACISKLLKYVNLSDEEDKVVLILLIQKRILNRIQAAELNAIYPSELLKELDDGILLKRMDMYRGNANKANNEKFFQEQDRAGNDVHRLEIEERLNDISDIPMNIDEKNFYDSLEEDEIRHMSISNEKSVINKSQTKKKKDEIVEIPSSPLFNFKEGQKKGKPHKHLFLDEKKEEFIFATHIKSKCLYCELLKGIYGQELKAFEKLAFTLLLPQKLESFNLENEFKYAMYQYLFDITMDCSVKFLAEWVIPLMNEVLADENLIIKYKTPIFMFYEHLVINDKEITAILFSMNYFAFHEYFLNSFMQNFELGSYVYFSKKLRTSVSIKKKNTVSDDHFDNMEIFQTVNRKKGDVQPDNNKARESEYKPEFEYKKEFPNTFPYVYWDAKKREFVQIMKTVNESEKRAIIDRENDKVEGRYTRYFWRLHTIHHQLRVVFEVTKHHPPNLRDNFKKQFSNFVFQIVESIIIFNKFSEKFIPTYPFNEDTECWNEIRNLLQDNMGVLNQILLKMISRYPNFFITFYRVLERNSNYALFMIEQIGNLPNIPSTVALLTSLYLYFDSAKTLTASALREEEITEYVQPISRENKMDKKELLGRYLYKVSDEMERVRLELNVILEENEKTLSNPKIYNKKGAVHLLKFMLACLQSINLLIIADSKSLDLDMAKFKVVLKNFFESLLPLFKLAYAVKLKASVNKFHKVDEVPKIGLYTDFLQVHSKDVDCFEMFLNITSVLYLFLWNVSTKQDFAAIYLQSQLLTYIIKNFKEIDCPAEGVFCLGNSYFFVSKHFENLHYITMNQPDFVKGILNCFLESDCPAHYHIPLFRAVKILLKHSPSDSHLFRSMVPRLRTYIKFASTKQEELTKPPTKPAQQQPLQKKQFEEFKHEMDELEISSIMNSEKEPELAKKGTLDLEDEVDLDKEELFIDMAASNEFGQTIQSLSSISEIKEKVSEQQDVRMQQQVEKEVKQLLRILALVNFGELTHGIKKMTNPRTKLIEGAGMLSMKTLEDYNKKLKKAEDNDNDSLSYLKKAQGSIFDRSALLVNPEKVHDSFDKLSFSSSFLRASNAENKTGGGGLNTINSGDNIFANKNKLAQNGNIIMNSQSDFRSKGMNELSKSYEVQDFGKKLGDISAISSVPMKHQSGNVNNLGTSSNISIFVGTGRNLLKKIDEEYEKILLKKF